MVDSTRDLLLGTTIEGRYLISARLGVGGMGMVYQATRVMIGDEVAVKILHAEQSDSHAEQRFRREAQAAARLKHPNAVNIYDFGITNDGLQYLVMELVEGQSLRQIIKQQGSLTPSTSAEVLAQVCAALDEAHRQKIIHRDVKPDNIIVSSVGTNLRIKVLDFGIAKLRDDATSSLTQTGNVLGTPHYMSPEQCLGEELDNRADIYSLGIVLYEMLVGRVPFNAPVSTAVIIQHVNQPPPALRTLNPGISPAVESVVLWTLEKRREARPQSGAELSGAFDSALHHGYVASAPLDKSVPSAPRVGASPSSAATTLLEVSPRIGDQTIAPAHSNKKVKVALVAAVALLLVVGGVFLFANRRQGNPGLNKTAAELGNSTSNPSAAVLTFNKNLAGMMGGKFRMVMKLQRNGNDLSGTYFYNPTNETMFHGNFTRQPEHWADKDIGVSRIDVQLKGTIDEQQNFSLDEFDTKGGKTGTFKGRFISDTELEGQWSKPNGKNVMLFSLKDEGSASSGSNYTITFKVFAKKSGGVKSRMNYPQLEGLADQKTQSDFNERVRALVSKDSNGSNNAEGETHEGNFSIDYRSADLISTVFLVGVDWTGEAHGMQYNFSFNYDLKHNRPVELPDLFLPGSNYLAVVSRLCATDIAQQKRKNGFTDIYEDGEKAASDSLKKKATFYPTTEGLIFIFDPYEVGSYAEGFYVVAVPYSQLSNIINAKGPLAPFVA